MACDYTTVRLKEFNKHKMTRKHEILTNPNKNSQQKPDCDCEKNTNIDLVYHITVKLVIVEQNELKERRKGINCITTDRKLILKLIEENKEQQIK